jgi:hypothetical protein
MTTRKGTDPRKAQFLAAGNAAQAAKVIDANPKRFRAMLRSKHGAYASKGTGWASLDNATRTAIFDALTSK